MIISFFVKAISKGFFLNFVIFVKKSPKKAKEFKLKNKKNPSFFGEKKHWP